MRRDALRRSQCPHRPHSAGGGHAGAATDASEQRCPGAGEEIRPGPASGGAARPEDDRPRSGGQPSLGRGKAAPAGGAAP
ncbi:hypothetical protein SDC9_117218 [bioreactor metagenome]|uniref:Uncharacterized protein n=1 Tax=bioreactor metagenome TaxID=1076179 RepID=A0A645C825_9ZZZZ